MKTLSVSNIKEYVKARLDELSNNEDAALVAGDNAVEDLDAIIVKCIVPAVRKIHLDAPNILLKDGVVFDSVILTKTQIGGTDYYKCSFTAPQDFLRLVTLQMSDWTRPIQTLVGEDSAEYRKQGNRYLIGTPSRPVGALVHRGGSGTLELFSCSSAAATMLSSRYIPEPAISSSNISVISTLEYPCMEQVTAEVLRSIGRYNDATVFDALAVKPFRIDPEWVRMNPADGERFNTTT